MSKHTKLAIKIDRHEIPKTRTQRHMLQSNRGSFRHKITYYQSRCNDISAKSGTKYINPEYRKVRDNFVNLFIPESAMLHELKYQDTMPSTPAKHTCTKQSQKAPARDTSTIYYMVISSNTPTMELWTKYKYKIT